MLTDILNTDTTASLLEDRKSLRVLFAGGLLSLTGILPDGSAETPNTLTRLILTALSVTAVPDELQVLWLAV